MAAPLKKATDGRAFGIGNLSTVEIMGAAKKICPSTELIFTVDNIFERLEPAIIFHLSHYYLYLKTFDSYLFFDSLGYEHALLTLGNSYIMPHVNTVSYQCRSSDTCGLFVLLVLAYFYSLDKKKRVALTTAQLLDELSMYLSHDTVENEFNVAIFAINNRIGEEFSDNPTYELTSNVLALKLPL